MARVLSYSKKRVPFLFLAKNLQKSRFEGKITEVICFLIQANGFGDAWDGRVSLDV